MSVIGMLQQRSALSYNFTLRQDTMNVVHVTSRGIASLLIIGIATWWMVAPTSYVACIRKVPLLWTSAYPMSARPWFPRYLRAFGILLWVLFLLGIFNWWRVH
jgi:hypothetical protein